MSIVREGCDASSYYTVLGVSSNATTEDIKKAYRRLAMEWHPDRWTRRPSMLANAKRMFQQVQEAYSVLSNERKRELYDAGLYDPDEEQDEGLSDFMHEMLFLMKQNSGQGKSCSLKELQVMFSEMVHEFEFHWELDTMQFDSADRSKKFKRDYDL